jgi:transposase
MVHYIGLEVSLKRTSICVVNQVGSVVREGVVESEPEAIATLTCDQSQDRQGALA